MLRREQLVSVFCSLLYINVYKFFLTLLPALNREAFFYFRFSTEGIIFFNIILALEKICVLTGATVAKNYNLALQNV